MYGGYGGAGLAGGIVGAIMGAMVFIILIAIAVYVVMGLAYYSIFKKANVNNPWLAWIPIANYIPLFDAIGVNRLNILWPIGYAVAGAIFYPIALATGSTGLMVLPGLIAIAYLVMVVIWYAKLLKCFGVSPLWLLLMIGLIIPFLDFLVGIAILVLFLVFAFNKNIQYRGYN